MSTAADEPRPLLPPPELIEAKALEHLGLTVDEFLRRWWAGAYRDDPRPEVEALNHLMVTGHWAPNVHMCGSSQAEKSPLLQVLKLPERARHHLVTLLPGASEPKGRTSISDHSGRLSLDPQRS